MWLIPVSIDPYVLKLFFNLFNVIIKGLYDFPADIQECSRPVDVCEHGVCQERMGDYRCNCFSGFAGRNCDKSKLLIKMS